MVVIFYSPIIRRFESAKSSLFALGEKITSVSAEEEDALQALDNEYNAELSKLKSKFDAKKKSVKVGKQAERETLLVEKGKTNKKVDGLKTDVEMARVSLRNAALDQISANNEYQVSDIHFPELTKNDFSLTQTLCRLAWNCLTSPNQSFSLLENGKYDRLRA